MTRPLDPVQSYSAPVLLLPQLLAVFRFAALILAYAVCKLRHWWAIAVSLRCTEPLRPEFPTEIWNSLINTLVMNMGEGCMCPLLQITTTVCCVFLIIKVILSKVRVT